MNLLNNSASFRSSPRLSRGLSRGSARFQITIIAALLFTLTGCQRYQPVLPTTQMRLGSRDYIVEIASEESTREHGLMDRDYMPANAGMIFVFSEDQPLEFYMKNTHIPLDIVFLDHAGRVVSIATMQPFDLRTTPSDGPAMYAIELNAGQAALTGLRSGDAVIIPDPARIHAK